MNNPLHPDSMADSTAIDCGQVATCMCIDMVGSTSKTINFTTEKIDRFNKSLIQQITPHLRTLSLEEVLLKFTGDGWLLITEKSSLIPNLCCLALTMKEKFQAEVAHKSDLTKEQIPSLRIALCQGRDIHVTLPDGRKDWVGDSARRATRAAQHCSSEKNEILVQDAIVIASSLRRDFEISDAEIDRRPLYDQHKNEEDLCLKTLLNIKIEAKTNDPTSPFNYVFTHTSK